MNRSIPNRRANIVRAAGALSGVVAGILAALLLPIAPAQAASVHRITIKQYMFMPANLTVEAGDTVTWTNQDQAAHNVVVASGPASFSSPMIAQGKSWSHTFTVAGPYRYVCSVHPGMAATITVTAPPPAPVAVPAAPASAASAPVPATTRTQPRSVAKPAARTVGVAAPAPASPAPVLVSAPAAAATLQPLLLVVGASVGVVVLCLLLIASRPIGSEVGSGGVRRRDD